MLTKQKVREMREDIQLGLDLIGESIGFKLKLGNAKFGETVVFKLEACPITKDGSELTTEMADFRRLAHRFGLNASDLGREFTTPGGKTYKIVGLVPRASRYPVLATGSDGKRYKFPAASVVIYLARTASQTGGGV